MRLSDLLHSSPMRLAGGILVTVFLAFIVAGWVTYHNVSADLELRTHERTRLATLEIMDIYEQSGYGALVNSLNARAAIADPDDLIFWLGTKSGMTLAGQKLTLPAPATGTYQGALLDRDPTDRYYLMVTPLEGYYLVVGRSYEENDAISENLRIIFLTAAGISILVSTLFATFLARRTQRRIDSIDSTLQTVASGDLDARIRLDGAHDDLSQLSSNINHALERLQNTVESIRQVGVDIAHDLRTPVSRLTIGLEGLRDSLSGDPSLQMKADQAVEEARGLVRTFDALLRISQIEAGARRARFEVVSLAEVAASLAEAYEAVVDDAGQSLTYSDESSDIVPLVTGDRELLIQLFANLIENAIHHAGERARIKIRLQTNKDCVCLSVSDTGPGIPQSERSRVLDRFFRLEKSRTNGGNGLGLSLVQAIAQLHDAQLELDDAEPGLVVRVRFNRAKDIQHKMGVPK